MINTAFFLGGAPGILKVIKERSQGYGLLITIATQHDMTVSTHIYLQRIIYMSHEKNPPTFHYTG